MAVSFDIFDTCLIRRCGDANNIFWLLGRKIFGDTTCAEMFFHWRVNAESEASKKYKRNVKLRDIYETNIPSFCIPLISKLLEEEMNLEYDMLRPISSTLSILKELRAAGHKIVFISDMYLPAEFLIRVLNKFDFYKEGDHIFVSCECDTTKSTGQLYRYAEKCIGEKIQRHYGDNLWSDVRMARKAEIRPYQIHTDFNEVEKYYIKKTIHKKHALFFSCIIGIMRYLRIIKMSSPMILGKKTDYESIIDISADFVAPIWIAYVLDVLNKAKRENFDRLYFLARDGYILKWTADLFKSHFPLLDLRYLYVSRKSMFLPSITSWSKEQLLPYFGGEMQTIECEHVYKYFKQNKEKSQSDITREINEARVRITSFFKQEGIFENDCKYALVDVGWKGSGRVAFNNIQKLNNCRECEVWYWGTFSEYRNKFSGSFYTYNINMELPIHFITLVEDFFSTSPDMSTIDYVKKSGKWEPVFDDQSMIDNHEILEANKLCLSEMANFINEYDIIDSSIYDTLSELAVYVLNSKPEYISLNALAKMHCFGEKENHKGMIHKLSAKKTIKYILGFRWNGWCEGDVAYSYKTYYRIIHFFHSNNRSFLLKIINNVKKIRG